MTALSLKMRGKIGKLFVMGCLAEKYRKELIQEIPEVDGYYGKFDWNRIITEWLDKEREEK